MVLLFPYSGPLLCRWKPHLCSLLSCSWGSRDNVCLWDPCPASKPTGGLPIALPLSRRRFPELFAWKIPSHPSHPWRLMRQSLVLSWSLHYTMPSTESEVKFLKCWSVCYCLPSLLYYKLHELKGFISFIHGRYIINSVAYRMNQCIWKSYDMACVSGTIDF